MEPTYTNGDPRDLVMMENGLMTDDAGGDIGVNVPMPPRMDRVFRRAGFSGYGQYDPALVAEPSAGTGILDSLGNALSQVITTIGQQAPGIITGQPTSPYPYGYPSAYPYGTQPGSNMMPLLLIGGGLLLFFMMSGPKKRRR